MTACDNHDGYVVVYDPQRRHGFSCPMCQLINELNRVETELKRKDN